MSGAPASTIKGLWTVYGDLVVHRDLASRSCRARSCSLVGGIGKRQDNAAAADAGVERPHRGSIGSSASRCTPATQVCSRKFRKRWGVLFQHGALYSALQRFRQHLRCRCASCTLSTRDFIRTSSWSSSTPSAWTSGTRRRCPRICPAAMIKRVALARALASSRAGVPRRADRRARSDSSEAFVKLVPIFHIKLNFTVVMATHDLDTLVSVSDRIACSYRSPRWVRRRIPPSWSADRRCGRKPIPGYRDRCVAITTVKLSLM